MERRAVELLSTYGLSEREAMVYLYLLQNGPTSAGEIAKFLQVRRMEAYRVVKKLVDANVVVASAGKPVRYSTQSVEDVIAERLEAQMARMKSMEDAKQELVSISRSLPQVKVPGVEQRFKIIQGREKIYNHILRMITGAKASVDAMLTRNDLVQAYNYGITDKLAEASRNGWRCRAVGFIDQNTVEAVASMPRSCDFRHSDRANIGRLVVVDGSETLSSLVIDDATGRKNERDIAIWSDSKDYAQMMSYLFEMAFAGAIPVSYRLRVISGEREVEQAKKSLVEIIRATLPLDGWRVEAPSTVMGLTGHEYTFDASLENDGERVLVDVVVGSKDEDNAEKVITSIMKRHEIDGPRLAIITRPGPSGEVLKLARLLGVSIIDGSDGLRAVATLRRAARGETASPESANARLA